MKTIITELNKLPALSLPNLVFCQLIKQNNPNIRP